MGTIVIKGSGKWIKISYRLRSVMGYGENLMDLKSCLQIKFSGDGLCLDIKTGMR